MPLHYWRLYCAGINPALWWNRRLRDQYFRLRRSFCRAASAGLRRRCDIYHVLYGRCVLLQKIPRLILYIPEAWTGIFRQEISYCYVPFAYEGMTMPVHSFRQDTLLPLYHAAWWRCWLVHQLRCKTQHQKPDVYHKKAYLLQAAGMRQFYAFLPELLYWNGPEILPCRKLNLHLPCCPQLQTLLQARDIALMTGNDNNDGENRRVGGRVYAASDKRQVLVYNLPVWSLWIHNRQLVVSYLPLATDCLQLYYHRQNYLRNCHGKNSS